MWMQKSLFGSAGLYWKHCEMNHNQDIDDEH